MNLRKEIYERNLLAKEANKNQTYFLKSKKKRLKTGLQSEPPT